MAASASPYEDTSVPVDRSQAAIRKRLATSGALGVAFEETWDEPRALYCRFIWPILTAGGDLTKVVVRIRVNPLEPDRRHDQAQRDRQAWRGIAHYLDATLKAAEFGLVRFEDVFLAFVEGPGGETIGDVLVPQIRAGALLQLEAGRGR